MRFERFNEVVYSSRPCDCHSVWVNVKTLVGLLNFFTGFKPKTFLDDMSDESEPASSLLKPVSETN